MSFLLLFCVQVAWADSQRSDTLEVLYRVGQSDIDLSYAGNAKRIDDFVQRVLARMATSNAKDISLTIRSGASPEGLKVLNDRLGAERGVALRDVLKSKIPFNVNIPIINEGPRWAALRQMIQNSDEPWKERALRILQHNPSENESEIDPMERQLRALDHGQVWQQIQAKYLTKLRSSGFAVIQEITEEQRLKDTLYIYHKDTIIYEPGAMPVYEPPVYYSRKPAIKTNLLLWGVGAPNVQLEIPLGKRNRWSIEGEFFMPWITWNENSHAEQALDAGIEIRYWLGNRMKHHTLDGWHIGLAAASGYYDIEWKKSEGYQGEFSNTYINIGWQKRFGRNRHWAFDAGVGLGWIHTKYRHYLGSSVYPVGHEEAQDYHLMWQDDLNLHKRYSQRRNFFGATHANISIAYFFGKQKYRAPGFVTFESQEAERQVRDARKQAKAADKEAANATRAAMNQAKAEAKEQAKAQKMAAKLHADQEKEAAKEAERAAKAEAKAAKAAAKESGAAVDKDAEKAAKAAAKEAEKAAKAEAKAAEEAAKAAEKEAAKQAKAEAKAAKAAAAGMAVAVDKDAEKAAKAAAKEAEKAAKAQAKAVEEAAKAAEKEAAEQAKAQAKAAKEAEKAAEQEAKAAAKAAKAAAKESGDTVDKDAEKAAKAAAKEAEKAAKAQAKAAEDAAKAAEKEAAEQAKAQAKAAKEAEKAAANQAKEAEKAAKEQAKAAEAQAKEQAAAAKDAEKAAAAQAKEAEKAAKEQAKAAEAQAKEQAKAMKEAEKAAAAAAKDSEKAAAAAAKEAEKVAKEKAKAEAAAAKDAEKAAAAAAKEAEKAAKEKAKAEAAAAKEAEKAAKDAAKAAEKAAKEAAKAEKSNAK